MPGVQREKDRPQAVFRWVDKLSQVGTHHLHALGGGKHNKLIALLRGKPKTFLSSGGFLCQALGDAMRLAEEAATAEESLWLSPEERDEFIMFATAKCMQMVRAHLA